MVLFFFLSCFEAGGGEYLIRFLSFVDCRGTPVRPCAISFTSEDPASRDMIGQLSSGSAVRV